MSQPLHFHSLEEIQTFNRATPYWYKNLIAYFVITSVTAHMFFILFLLAKFFPNV